MIQKWYLSDQEHLESQLPTAHPVEDTPLFEALSGLYRLLEAERAGRYLLIFDYRGSLENEPPELRERAVAVLEYSDPAERDAEIEAIRRSLWGGDDGAAAGVPALPILPTRTMQAAKVLSAAKRVV